jgi:hypothetical protein
MSCLGAYHPFLAVHRGDDNSSMSFSSIYSLPATQALTTWTVLRILNVCLESPPSLAAGIGNPKHKAHQDAIDLVSRFHLFMRACKLVYRRLAQLHWVLFVHPWSVLIVLVQGMTKLTPSSALMGVGIASALVRQVRINYYNSRNGLKIDSLLVVPAYLHCTVRQFHSLIDSCYFWNTNLTAKPPGFLSRSCPSFLFD